jgi:predicted RNA-binding protein YlqC (UPF0109 family)
MDVRELVKQCAEEVLKLLGEDLDAYGRMRVYGNALIECVRRHFVKKVLPDKVGYDIAHKCFYAIKQLPVSYDVWGCEIDKEVVILKVDWCPQDVEGEIERLKKEEVAFCFIDKETQKVLQEELQKYVCLDCDEHKSTPALMCWRASYMEDKSPLEEWNVLARKLKEEWEREREEWRREFERKLEEERRRKEEEERLERERKERERQELREKLLKGEAYVVKDKYFKRCYYLERENGRLVLRVPKWMAGHIIGKGGQRIKSLQEFLGEKVYVETYEDLEPRKIELSFGW